MSDDLEGRIQDLEYRLEWYHSALTEAIEQRDRFALDAAWGIVRAGGGISAVITALLVTLWVDWNPWIEGGIAIAVMIGVAVYLSTRTERAYDDDQKRLARLPQWKAKID